MNFFDDITDLIEDKDAQLQFFYIKTGKFLRTTLGNICHLPVLVNIIYPTGASVGKIIVTCNTTFDQLFRDVRREYPFFWHETCSLLHTGIVNYRSCDLYAYQHYDTVWEVAGRFNTLVLSPKTLVTTNNKYKIRNSNLILASLDDIKELPILAQLKFVYNDFHKYFKSSLLIFVYILKTQYNCQEYYFYNNQGEDIGSMDIFW